MKENFREFLERLREANELLDIRQPVDIRHIATLVDQSDKALMFHDVIGYDMPVVSGIIRSRQRSIMSMGCESYGEIEQKLRQGIDNPIAPKYVETAKHKQVIRAGDEVELRANGGAEGVQAVGGQAGEHQLVRSEPETE